MSAAPDGAGVTVRDSARIKYKLMDSWFIFYLRKINTCYYTDTTSTREQDNDCWS
jgi:hypothetical protein